MPIVTQRKKIAIVRRNARHMATLAEGFKNWIQLKQFYNCNNSYHIIYQLTLSHALN